MVLELFLIALVAGIGLSHLIVDGNIFAKLRGDLVKKYRDTQPWVIELITCYQCTGFWAGAVMGLLLQPIYWYHTFSHVLWGWFALVLSIPFYLLWTPVITGAATSYVSMAAAALLNWLDAPAMAAAAKKNEKDNGTGKA